MSSSEALTILVGSCGPATAVRDALRDWSAEGLLDDFAWVTEESARAADPLGVLVSGGAAQGVRVQELLARRASRLVRIVSLQNLADCSERDTAAPAQHLVHVVHAAGGAAQLVRMRLFLILPGQPLSEPRPVEGWHNIVLSPEDAQSPDSPKMSLPSTMSVVEFGAWAAPSVAALTGMYAGLTGSPFDRVDPLPGRQVRAARAFYRRLDGTALENVLRAQVLTLGESYPQVRDGSQESQYIEDAGVELATSAMAQALWSRHQHLLKGVRVPAHTAKVEPIGPMRALAMFFSFLLSALKNAPVAWWSAAVAGTKAKLASGVQAVVFGDGSSRYRVAIRGMAADDPVTLEERLAQIRSMEQAIASVPHEHEVHVDLTVVWQEWIAGAHTLMDGGERVPAMPPVQIGTRRGVLKQASQCVPDSSCAFTQIPGALASAVGVRAVSPADTLTAHQLWERLDQLGTDPQLGVEADQAKRALQTWASRHGRTYAAQCAGPLASAFRELSAEIDHLRDVLRRASSTDPADDATRQAQVRMARTLRWLLSGLLVVLGLLVVGGVTDVLGWVLVTVVGLLSVGSWLVSSFMVFVRGQRGLFRLLHEREKAVSESGAAQRNLVQAIRDAGRVGDAYGLFLQWSRVLGAFLANPLGERQADAHAGSMLDGALPLAARLGVAQSDDTSLTQVAHQLRTSVFAPGWLDPAWRDCLRSAGPQLGPAAAAELSQPEDLYRQRAVEEDHLLRDWADVLEREGVRSQAGDRMWVDRVLPHADAESLVTLVAQPDGTRTTLGEFMHAAQGAEAAEGAPGPQGARRTAAVGRPRLFSDLAFSEVARVDGKHAVVEAWSQVAEAGLGRRAVLVELSAGVRPGELVGADESRGSRWSPGTDKGEHF